MTIPRASAEELPEEQVEEEISEKFEDEDISEMTLTLKGESSVKENTEQTSAKPFSLL